MRLVNRISRQSPTLTRSTSGARPLVRAEHDLTRLQLGARALRPHVALQGVDHAVGDRGPEAIEHVALLQRDDLGHHGPGRDPIDGSRRVPTPDVRRHQGQRDQPPSQADATHGIALQVAVASD